LILLRDMSSRITNNRYATAPTYDTAGSLGTGAACPTDTATRRDADLTEWCNAIIGASETLGSGNVGSLVSGRGCVEQFAPDEYLVTVAWQGLAPISAPPASVTCGQNEYDGGTECTNDRCRRVVTTVVRIPTLT
jgi:type IV pilus assembly protein PilV